MALSFRRPRTKHAPQQKALKSGRVQIPSGGMNNSVPLAKMSGEFMPYCYNIFSSEEGVTTRQGYREWVTGLGAQVRTLIPYHAVTESGSDDKLFAVTPDGFYDVTASAASPAISVSFGTTTGRAGFGNYIQYTNDAGDKRILYADGANGLYVYTPGSGWALETAITGLTEADVRYVAQHKLRIWLAVKDSAKAWYLGVGAYTGAATEFNFAAQFPNGGYIVGMWNWTVDGGAGVDDLFVVLSSSGDVVVYQGEDPSSASTWTIKGKWNIGTLPAGRNLGVSIGGELHLLSTYGLVSMNDLLRGVPVDRITGQTSLAKNIVLAIRNDMVDRDDSEGWGFYNNLSNGFVLLTRPVVSDTDTPLQYVFNVATNAWGMFRDVPMICGASYNGVFYFGDRFGVVHYFTSGSDSLDGVARAGTGGDPVNFSFLTSFEDWGEPATFKIGQFVRPTFIAPSGTVPSYTAKILYDYNLSEFNNTATPGAISGDVWDTATWDNGVWEGANSVGYTTAGASGMGRVCAVAIRGDASYRTKLIDMEVMFTAGGQL